LSIFLQSIERFVHIEVIEEPFLVLIVGCVGLSLNIVSALVVHGESSSMLTKGSSDVHTQDHHGHGGHGHGQPIPMIESELNSAADTLRDHIVRSASAQIFFRNTSLFHFL
jgi:zinc transporter 1